MGLGIMKTRLLVREYKVNNFGCILKHNIYWEYEVKVLLD